MNKTNLVIMVFLFALAVPFVLGYMSHSSAPPKNRESFAQKESGMPINGPGMGPYDNVSVPGASGWTMNEQAPKGASPVAALQNLNFLSNPRTSPSCCPSQFNTDSGCVCLSDSDISTMTSRGGNRA